MPPSPSPPSGAAAPSPDGAARVDTTTASPGTPEHCVVVAGGITTAMLAPLALRSGADPEELTALERQLLELRDKVPADLHDDFTTLARSVEAPPRGSGTFDEKTFRQAMAPVQDWLGRHCTHS